MIRASVILCTALLAACANQQRMNIAELDFVREHYTLAFNHLQLPARHGDPDAEYAMGYMYYYGKGVVEDRKRAEYWFKLAADGGQHDAALALKMIQAQKIHYHWPHNEQRIAQGPAEIPFGEP